MSLHVVKRGESLADIGHVTQDTAQAAFLAELQLGGDILERGSAGGLPFHTAAKADAQFAGDRDPAGITQHFFGLAVLHGTVNRSCYTQGGG